jgi:hypothetical protein
MGVKAATFRFYEIDRGEPSESVSEPEGMLPGRTKSLARPKTLNLREPQIFESAKCLVRLFHCRAARRQMMVDGPEL